MTTVIVTLKAGNNEVLKDALVSACHHYSSSTVQNKTATLTYICETADSGQAIDEVQDSISIDGLESLRVELVGMACR